MNRQSKARQDMIAQRQAFILNFIRDFRLTHAYGPSVREIRDALGVASTSTVKYHLQILQDSDVVTWDFGIARSIRLWDKGARK